MSYLLSDRERAEELCHLIGHDLIDNPYGWTCVRCGMFYPDDEDDWSNDEDEFIESFSEAP